MYIVAGVSSSGKSTFISNGLLDQFGIPASADAIFASQQKARFGRLHRNNLLHYNLLRFRHFKAGTSVGNPVTLSSAGFRNDPVFRRIQRCAVRQRIKGCLLIVPSKTELLKRMATRERVEESESTKLYDNQFWLKEVQAIDLCQLHEAFLLEMECVGVPPVLLASRTSPEGAPSFVEIPRYSLRREIERGDAPSLADVSIRKLAANDEFEYQRINFGRSSFSKGQKRQRSILEALSVDVRNASILDIGSAIGALSFSAEQMGARKVVGLEPSERRFRCALALKEVSGSACEFQNTDLLSMRPRQRFDHVFMLNVIHHMDRFFEVLSLIGQITARSLTIEFPGLADNKFKRTAMMTRRVRSPTLPLIGVSNPDQDQTFLYSPEALRRLVNQAGGPFKSYLVWESPMYDRFFMRFFTDFSCGHTGRLTHSKIFSPARPERRLRDRIIYELKRNPIVRMAARRLGYLEAD